MKTFLWQFMACVTIVATALSSAAVRDKPDLTKIEHLPHKGRVQDDEGGGKQPVIEALIQRGTNAIPLLIEMLDDETVIDHIVVCYWPLITVGDLAFVILTDLVTDRTWTNATIPGATWNEMLESKPDPKILIPPYHQLQEFKHNHGNKALKSKWQKIWTSYRERAFWDQKEKCFKLQVPDTSAK